jgi:hypothetical protein
MRLAGTPPAIVSAMSGTKSVCTRPGATAFTVTPRRATSTATVRVSASSPAFDAA